MHLHLSRSIKVLTSTLFFRTIRAQTIFFTLLGQPCPDHITDALTRVTTPGSPHEYQVCHEGHTNNPYPLYPLPAPSSQEYHSWSHILPAALVSERGSNVCASPAIITVVDLHTLLSSRCGRGGRGCWTSHSFVEDYISRGRDRGNIDRSRCYTAMYTQR